MGVNTHHDDYFESLFRRTTASYRAKFDKENVATKAIPKNRINGQDDNLPTTSKQAQNRQRILHERNRQREADSTTTSDHSVGASPSKAKIAKSSQVHGHGSLKNKVENMVAQILQDKFANAREENKRRSNLKNGGHKRSHIDENSVKAIVTDLVNRILNEKLAGPRDGVVTLNAKPLTSVIEDIVTDKLKEHLAQHSNASTKNQHVEKLNAEIQQKLHLSQDKNSNKTLGSEALMAELLADSNPKPKGKQRSPSACCNTPEWEQLGGAKSSSTGIKRLPRKQCNAPEWQETDEKIKTRSTSAQKDRRANSPVASSSGRSSRNHFRGAGVLIRRSVSHGRSTKPNNADPVALYQYYKNEWEHFRRQIPGETNHNRLRWHIKQKLLDPE